MVGKVVAIILSMALMALAPDLAGGHGNEVPEGEAKEQAAPAVEPSPGMHNMMGTDRMSTPGMRTCACRAWIRCAGASCS